MNGPPLRARTSTEPASLMHQGECVGAIGVSGVQSHEDEQVAQAGVAVLG